MSRIVVPFIVLAFLFLAGCGGPPDKECINDRVCGKNRAESSWGIDAAWRCEVLIEAHARYTHRWTDGFFEEKFPTKDWLHGAKEVRLSGRSVEFQNGFGAWSRMSYTCTYDPISELVTDVTVR